MNMSKAAIAPKQPSISKKNREHPLFCLYEQHRSFCSNNLVEADSFEDWLYQYERNLVNEQASKHPEYPNFLNWMRENKGGARECPAGSFPHNMYFWINGGRW